jgi:hypothetical protein
VAPRHQSRCSALVRVGIGAALLLSIAAACGGSPVDVSSNLPLALHRLETARTGVVKTDFVFAAEGQSLPPVVYVTRFDNVQKRIETSMDLRRFIRFYNQTIPTSSRVGKTADWRFDIIADSSRGLVLYLASPLFEEASFQAKLPAGIRHKRWMKVDFVEALVQGIGPTNQLLGFLPGFGSPLSYFKALSARGVSAPEIERIDGVDAKAYAETVNLRPYLGELPRVLRKIIARSSPKMAARVWIDPSSNVRRIRLTSQPMRGGGGAVMIDTTDLRDLGRPIAVKLPRTQQVFDAAALGAG